MLTSFAASLCAWHALSFPCAARTSLVDLVHLPMLRARGLFARGKVRGSRCTNAWHSAAAHKARSHIHPLIHGAFYLLVQFDLYKRSSSVVVQAFQQLLLHLLTRAPAERESWRVQLQNALGVEAQVLVDLIPQLGALLGPQAKVAQLPAAESERRLLALIVVFARVFATPAHPLCLFVDDLQWADSQTLSLIKLLFELTGVHLLIIGKDTTHAGMLRYCVALLSVSPLCFLCSFLQAPIATTRWTPRTR